MVQRQNHRMKLSTNTHQRGIALGPILFIIAVLAILAAAIAAGSGSFSANTNTESAKAMAEVAIQSCHAYQDALQIMLHNECDITALDYTPSGGGWPSGETTWVSGDYTGGNGTNRAGNGKCAFFDPRGGGMIFKPLPTAALAANPTGAYTTQYTGTPIDSFAGYPWFSSSYCINGQGTCSPATDSSHSLAPLVFKYFYIDPTVCQKINDIIKNNLTATSASVGNDGYAYAIYSGTNLRGIGAYVAGAGISGTTLLEGCARDGYSNGASAAYAYMCALYIR